MTKRVVAVLVILCFLVSQLHNNLTRNDKSPDDKLPAKVLSFRTAGGWGYEIVIDGRTFIHQDYIPAIQGNKSFQSSEEALKVGNYLLEKMKNRERPLITVEELKNMKIKEV